MSHHTTRPAAAWQEPYDAIPRSVQARTDLTFGAKCLYGALRTAQQTRWQPTYAELAAHLAASTRSIVRWVQQLATAGLIAVRRRGQGLSNLITLVGLVTSGREIVPRPAVTDWQPPTRARHSNQKEQGRKNGSIHEEYRPGPIQPGMCFGCGSRGHGTAGCQKYRGLVRT